MPAFPGNDRRILVLAAHPDDETIACSGLLQRAFISLVVFAVDGAPSHYGFEKTFGSLPRYSSARFFEASRALGRIPYCSFRRLTRPDGHPFADQHLFLELPAALSSLLHIAGEFAPDLIVHHAFEGGHIDHDACYVLGRRAAQTLNLPDWEFPLYWKSLHGQDVFQQFRGPLAEEVVLQLNPEEQALKRKMLAGYKTQKGLLSVFQTQTERFRTVFPSEEIEPEWAGYPFENRSQALPTELFMQKVRAFEESLVAATSRVSPSPEVHRAPPTPQK